MCVSRVIGDSERGMGKGERMEEKRKRRGCGRLK